MEDPKTCRRCRGTGIDPDAHHRYTTGGHDDRRCRECNGDCVIGLDDAIDDEEDTVLDEET